LPSRFCPAGKQIQKVHIMRLCSHVDDARALRRLGVAVLFAAAIIPSARAQSTDIQPPSVPAGLTATAVGADRVSLAWSAAVDDTAVTRYIVYDVGGAPLATVVAAPTPAITISGLAPLSGYQLSVAACDAAGNCSVPSVALTITTGATGMQSIAPALAIGWNLLGNSLATALEVASHFGVADNPVPGVSPNIESVWAWNAASGTWSFHSPQLGLSDNAAYAAAHGLTQLGSIAPGQGYWVKTLAALTLPARVGAAFNYHSFNFAALPQRWNLISHAGTTTPSAFNALVSPFPPSPDTVPTGNFSSLWMWDTAAARWLFHAPALESAGGLAAVKTYADANGLLHFADTGRQIGAGAGFYVNRGDDIPDAIVFAPVANAQPGATVTSAEATAAGLTGVAPVRVTGGQLLVNGTAYAGVQGDYALPPTPDAALPGAQGIVNGDRLALQLTASALPGASTEATLNAGGLGATFTVTTAAIDTSAPTAPASISATVAAPGQINIEWTAATDNVAVTNYRVLRGGNLIATIAAPDLTHTDSGLAAGSSFSYTVQACDAAGNCSIPSSTATATTPGSSISLSLESGFNLLGNSLDTALDVMALFGNQTQPVAGITENVASVWKWDADNGQWYFHSPLLGSSANAAYAQSRGYHVLTSINPGEGYWVNALSPLSLPAQVGAPFDWTRSVFLALPSGFNLLAQHTARTPVEFNLLMSPTGDLGGVPTDAIITIWAWDAFNARWYFHSPLVEAGGGIQSVKSYADSHNFQHFPDFDKKLEPGMGFWVNKF